VNLLFDVNNSGSVEDSSMETAAKNGKDYQLEFIPFRP
jgi:hypothetical protein